MEGYAIILACEKESKHDRVEMFMLHRSDDTIISPDSPHPRAERSSCGVLLFAVFRRRPASEVAVNAPACFVGV